MGPDVSKNPSEGENLPEVDSGEMSLIGTGKPGSEMKADPSVEVAFHPGAARTVPAELRDIFGPAAGRIEKRLRDVDFTAPGYVEKCVPVDVPIRGVFDAQATPQGTYRIDDSPDGVALRRAASIVVTEDDFVTEPLPDWAEKLKDIFAQHSNPDGVVSTYEGSPFFDSRTPAEAAVDDAQADIRGLLDYPGLTLRGGFGLPGERPIPSRFRDPDALNSALETFHKAGEGAAIQVDLPGETGEFVGADWIGVDGRLLFSDPKALIARRAGSIEVQPIAGEIEDDGNKK